MKPISNKHILIFVITFSIFVSCNSKNEEKTDNKHKENEYLIEANLKAVKTEDQQIIDFIARYKWNMIKTGTGLRYLITKKSGGKLANKRDVITFAYVLRNIQGDIVYTSEKKGHLTFVVGHDEVISGLHEAALHLRNGDKAKLIIPSHLAYGATGDDVKIPPKSTLIYEIEVLNLEFNK